MAAHIHLKRMCIIKRAKRMNKFKLVEDLKLSGRISWCHTAQGGKNPQWHFGLHLKCMKIAALFFLFHPNCWLFGSLLWPSIHFSWQTTPNQSATDLVQIRLVSEVGFQCWGPVESWPALVGTAPRFTHYPKWTLVTLTVNIVTEGSIARSWLIIAAFWVSVVIFILSKSQSQHWMAFFFLTVKPWSHASLILWRMQAKVPFEWKNLKALTIQSQKCISVYFGVRGFQPSHRNAHCSLTMWPWWNSSGGSMVGLCPHWVNKVRLGEGGGLARHNPAVRLIWGEQGKMEGAKLALICPSPAQGPESRGYELLISGCIPADPWWCRKTDWDVWAPAQCSWAAKLRHISYQICFSEYWRGHNQPVSKTLTCPIHSFR